ncbi:MAG: class II aldolase/adducin family protein [Bdellovibrionales bacterium]|nr:class II aldolase/adducin family protein [Bdellovibrionales bacterium]
MHDEGYVKYRAELVEAPPPDSELAAKLNYSRSILRSRGMIGVYPDGVGFGNISARLAGSISFVISGTATGGIETLEAEHFTTVTAFDIERNWLRCEGPIAASSEAMTHGAVYLADASAAAVIHVHSEALWTELLEQSPATSAKVEYGTPEMAREVVRLLRETAAGRLRIFAMAGHREGVIAFGGSLDEARETIISAYNKVLER